MKYRRCITKAQQGRAVHNVEFTLCFLCNQITPPEGLISNLEGVPALIPQPNWSSPDENSRIPSSTHQETLFSVLF